MPKFYKCESCDVVVDDEHIPWQDCELCGVVYCTECAVDNLKRIEMLEQTYIVCQDCEHDLTLEVCQQAASLLD